MRGGLVRHISRSENYALALQFPQLSGFKNRFPPCDILRKKKVKNTVSCSGGMVCQRSVDSMLYSLAIHHFWIVGRNRIKKYYFWMVCGQFSRATSLQKVSQHQSLA